MRTYWLMDRHGSEGPTALVETDGSMHVVRVLRFGPGITGLDDQQRIWDDVIGRVAPTMKPFVDASTVDEEGVEPHAKLRRDDHSGTASNRAGRRGGRPGGGGGRVSEGPSNRRGRGDR